MFFTYNMGVGFCVVVDPKDAEAVLRIAANHGAEGKIIGHTEDDLRKEVRIPKHRLVGYGGKFYTI